MAKIKSSIREAENVKLSVGKDWKTKIKKKPSSVLYNEMRLWKYLKDSELAERAREQEQQWEGTCILLSTHM